MYKPQKGDFIRRVNIPNEATHKMILAKNPHQIPYIGRWGRCINCDILVFTTTDYGEDQWCWRTLFHDTKHKRELSLDVILDIEPPVEHQKDKDAWIPHKGNKCPVQKDTLIDIKHRDGTERHGVLALVSCNDDWCDADEEYWLNLDDGCDIVAWRPHVKQSAGELFEEFISLEKQIQKLEERIKNEKERLEQKRFYRDNVLKDLQEHLQPINYFIGN